MSIDPVVLVALSDLATGLRAQGVGFCVIGALVPEVLLEEPPTRRTNDADATVVVETLDDFERVKIQLEEFGFRRTKRPYRLTHKSGGWVDLIPYSRTLAPTGRLELSDDVSFNLAGFEMIIPNVVDVVVSPGLGVPLVPVALYVLLKIVAYGDRKEWKDLGSVLHCLRHYRESDDARYGLEHQGELVPYEYTTACLLGLDAKPFAASVATSARAVLDLFDGPDAPIVGLVAHGIGRLPVEDGDREEVYACFRWFRLAADV